jgi:hypothetical protein
MSVEPVISGQQLKVDRDPVLHVALRQVTFFCNERKMAIDLVNSHPIDRLIGGVLTGAIVTAAVSVILSYIGMPSGYGSVGMRAAAPIVVSAGILFPRPILLRTVLGSWRDPVLLDEDLTVTLKGRAVGLIGGFFFGITLCSEIL